jgi:CheY-like chemotaxis protein
MSQVRAQHKRFLSDTPEELQGWGQSDGDYSDEELPYGFELRSINPSHNSVLVLDDDPDQAKMLQRLIEKAGYHVMTATSAAEALGMVAEKQFSVIVSDYKMPEMNGFEFLQALRGLEAAWPTTDIPVILLTACGDDLEFAALERGADMFCEKHRADALLVKQIRFLLEM